MKIAIYYITTFLSSACSSWAFINHQTLNLSPRVGTPIRMVDLEPEPEGGKEMTQFDTGLDQARMKDMGATEEKRDGSDVHKFWLQASADGSVIKKTRTTVVKEASRKADFPGFRKGQIPPYAQPQMTMFAVQEGIIKTCEAAVVAFGLKAIPDSDGGAVEVNEDVKELVKGYTLGDNIAFTGTFIATYDQEKQAKKDEEESVATETD